MLLLEPRVHADLHDLPAPTSLGGIARVHVLRIGDGAEHVPWWFMARPAGFVQARGSFAVEWEADLQRVAASLSETR